MRGRSVLVVAVLALATACASPEVSTAAKGSRPAVAASRPAAEAARPQAPPVTSSLPPTSVRPPATAPSPRLPQPVPIPADSYAPEPVVEIGTMEIPAIGLKDRIFQGVTLRNIDLGPSHWTGSAMPGEIGNTVFAGHRATNGEPFRRIDELVPGDEVRFAVGGKRWTYRVTGHLVVAPADTWIANQTTAATGTLYACHPVGSMAERYVVRLELVS